MNVWCAVNDNGVPQWSDSSNRKTKFFSTERNAKKCCEAHNGCHKHKWHVVKYELVPINAGKDDRGNVENG